MSWLIPHVDEVLSGTVCGAKIGHATFVNDAYFVEELIEALSRLIDGYKSSEVPEICSDAQSLDKFEGSRCIETTC